MYYRLEGKKPVPCSFEEWVAFFEPTHHVVALTDVGPLSVSTVFIGISFANQLFETVVFDSRLPRGEAVYQQRYSTWERAEEEHALIVARLERGLPPAPSQD